MWVGVDCPSEHVDLLVWVSHYHPGHALLHEDLQHGGVHILPLVQQENVVVGDPLKVGVSQLPKLQVAVVRHPHPHILLVRHGPPHRLGVLQHQLPLLGGEIVLGVTNCPDTGHVLQAGLTVGTVEETV